MKIVILVVFVFFTDILFAQTKGFEFLSSSKTALESLIKNYANSIPDTSETYKKYYIPLALHYNNSKTAYNGYRGSMKDCILNNDGKKKIQHCLQSKSINIQAQLDTLNSILQTAYLEASSKTPHSSTTPDYSGKNTGLITGSIISNLLDTLIIGALKLVDQIKKYKKDYKDYYLAAITDKQYDLADIDDLLSKKATTPTK